jgi:rare lipoprotein A
MRLSVSGFMPFRTDRPSILVRFSLLAALAGLPGCASTGDPGGRVASAPVSQVDAKYGVKASPRVVADGDEVPKGGGNFMVGKPYKIAGKTYYPSEKPYSAIGTASWYGTDFHGRRTANGEVFDRASITAAHPTMPLPSYARVTNMKNARSIIVRVNDRGPYHGGRVMDVSQRVAEALDFRNAGKAKVKVEWIGRANIAGDEDARLLATLRDDAPANLESEGLGPVIASALRNTPVERVAEAATMEVESLAYAAEGRTSGDPGQSPRDPVATAVEEESQLTTPFAVGATARGAID